MFGWVTVTSERVEEKAEQGYVGLQARVDAKMAPSGLDSAAVESRVTEAGQGSERLGWIDAERRRVDAEGPRAWV